MTRLVSDGFEFGSTGLPGSSGPLIGGFSNAPTFDTGTVRTGTYSLKCINTNQGCSLTTGISVASTTYYLRVFFNFAVLPSVTSRIMILGNTADGATDINVRCTSGGALQLFRATTQIGSDTAALSTGTWYQIEISGTLDGSAANWTAAELRLDGTTQASASGFSTARSAAGFFIGWCSSPTTGTLYMDDVGLNSSAGSVNNTWCGNGKNILMFPISDNARGAWTAGAGGTTNLFSGVDNRPPVGVADASATDTSQIKNKSATNPTSYDGNLDTYINAGVGSSDTITSIFVFGIDGEDPATGTKTGAYSMVSNPAIAEPAAFNFGNDGGAQSTYKGLWTGHYGTLSEAPSVTLSSAPVIRARCISGATAARAASVCFLGAFVEYLPAAAVRVPRSPGIDSGFGHL